MFIRHKSMSYPKRYAITGIVRLCNSRFKLPFLTIPHLLSICIVITILNDVNTRPAKLTLFRGSQSFRTSTLQCKAGVYLRKPGTYTCACVTGIWGFYGEYCKKPVTIAAGDNYCFRLKKFTVVPFGNPEHPFEPTLNIFHDEFHSLKQFHLNNNDTDVDPFSSFLIITDEPWTLYGDTDTPSICLRPTVQGKRKFCMFSKRPSNKIHSVRKKWSRIRRVSRGCNTTLVWRADSCTDILPPNDFAECGLEAAEQPEEIEPDLPTTEPSSTSTTDKPRFKFFKGWVQIQPKLPTPALSHLNETIISTDLLPPESSDSEVMTIYLQKPSGQNPIGSSTVPLKVKEVKIFAEDLPLKSEERWIKIKPKHPAKPQDASHSSNGISAEERWIKIQSKRQNFTRPEKDLSSEKRWIKIQPKSKNQTILEKYLSSEERWIKIQSKSKNLTVPQKDLSSEGRRIKIQPESKNPNVPEKSLSSEERWIKIQPISTNLTVPEKSFSSEERWIKIQPISKNLTVPDKDLSSEERWIKIQHISKNRTVTEKSFSSEERWIRIQPRHRTNITEPESRRDSVSSEWTRIKPRGNSLTTEATTVKPVESSSEERWIVIKGPSKIANSAASTKLTSTTTSTTLPPESKYVIDDDTCAGAGFNGLTRSKVKEYWLDPDTDVCARSINEAVFTDQLRRFTVKQFNHLFPSRLRSLIDVELMLNYTKRIIQVTCPHEFVPNVFFEIVFQAMVMFMQEDFFYGVEAAHPDSLRRIVQSLSVCLEKASPFVFEYDELDCGVKKINGWIILPGKREKLELPEGFAYNKLEPLIETTWKMFLNAHSLCFSHFRISNDHHHFAKLIMEAFSKTIYDKWIEPIESFDLYELILPNFNFLHETMQNIDYCVAAVSKVSTCPVWMSRTGERDKTELIPSSSSRQKRSVWMGPVNNTKSGNIWDGAGICMQQSNDPEQILQLSPCE